MKDQGRCFNTCWCLRCEQSSGSVCRSWQLEPSSQPKTRSGGASAGGEDRGGGPAGHGSSARCYSDPGWHHKGQEVNNKRLCLTVADVPWHHFLLEGFHGSRNHPSLWGSAGRPGGLWWSSRWWLTFFLQRIQMSVDVIFSRWYFLFCLHSNWPPWCGRVHPGSAPAGCKLTTLVEYLLCLLPVWQLNVFQALNITTHVLKPGGTFVAKVNFWLPIFMFHTAYIYTLDGISFISGLRFWGNHTMLCVPDLQRQRRDSALLSAEDFLLWCHLC